MWGKLTGALCAAAFAMLTTPAQAVIIDFESFNVGDGLAAVNAVTGRDAIFDAGPNSQTVFPFMVAVDPNDASNQVIMTGTNTNEADVLVNFSMPVNFFQVTFIDNPDGGPFGVLILARDKTGTAAGILGDMSANQVGFQNGTEPSVLSISAAGIRSVQIESGSGALYFDTIEYRFAPKGLPEPATLVLFGFGLAGLGLAASRRTSRTSA